MKKIIIIFYFFSFSCWSQKTVPTNAKTQTIQYIPLDSLIEKSLFFTDNLGNGTLKTNSKKLYTFLGQLNDQKKIRQLRNEDDFAIKNLQSSTLVKLILHVHAPNKAMDSVIFYQKKILSLTDRKNIRACAYGATAFAYQKNDMMTEAIKNYEKTFEELKASKPEDPSSFKVSPLVNIIECLLELGSIEHAERRLLALSQAINEIPQHTKYNQWQQLIKILQASIFVDSKRYGQALDVLTTVDKSKIKTQHLLTKYYLISCQTQTGLANYALADYYLEKQFSTKENINDISSISYYIRKLSFALYDKNKEKAAIYFKKIDKLTTANKEYKSPENFEVLSRYYASKNDYKKAFDYLKENNLLKYNADRKNAKIRLDIDRFYVQVNTALVDMKQLNVEKDELIITNRLFYMGVGVITLILFGIILIFLTGYRRIKQYKLDVLIKSKQTLMASEQALIESNRSIVESKQKFLENVSHEIRTPITAIMGYLTLLQENSLNPEKRKKYATSAFRNSEKMILSLNRFLALLRAEKSPVVNSKNTSIIFKTFIQQVISSFLPDFEIKNILFYYHTNIENNLSITYDIESLRTILNNLMSNAIKYSNSNTSIYLTLNFTETHLQITVKDQGIGISEDEKEKVFSRFYQSKDNATEGGFGIGLSLITELVQKLNGIIRLQTELNVGSVFFIDLPFELPNYSLHAAKTQKEFKLLSLDPSLVIKTKENSNYPKALIVDDNLEMIAYFKELFSGFLQCTFAFNGAEALVKAKEISFDIIISDLKMPVMNGADFKLALNKIENQKEIPFIMISAIFYNKLEDLKNALGLHEYIEKPFTKDEIFSRVQFALERSMNRKKIFDISRTNLDFDNTSAVLIEKIKECILSNLTNTDFNVTMLAEVCGYEQKKLNQILKNKLGLGLINIILEVRLLKAYEFIIKNSFPTQNEVMYAVGLNSRSYFNKKFEKRFGIKVGELKKKNDCLNLK
jgi:signal transduction histidine kinase/DNA-binding response OmpR family regulator